MYAQNEFGIRVGWNHSAIHWTHPNVSHSMNSITGGINFDVKLKNNISLLCELDFISKGYHSEFDYDLFSGPIVHVDEITKYNFLELPLIVKYNLPMKNGNVHFLAGPSVGYAVNGRNTIKSNGSILSSSDINFNNEKLNRFDIAGNLGFGLSFQAGSVHIVPEFRYQLGLVNLNESEEVFNKNRRITTSCMLLSIAVTLPVKLLIKSKSN